MKHINKPKKQKKWLFPTAIEREYVKYLRGVSKQISDTAKQKLSEIEPHFKKQLRQDAFSDLLEQWLIELLFAISFFVNERELLYFVQGYIRQVADFNKKQFHKVLKSAYSVDIFVSEPWLDEELKLAEWQNINLIKSIPQQFHEKLRYRMVEAVRKGESYQSLADDLEKLFDIPKRRATLIARDQIGKLNGRLTQLRQENIGVKSYIWRGVLDERERLNHVEREGEEFRWDNPPEDGHPGEPILCRCSAEAVLPEFDKLEGVIATEQSISTPFKEAMDYRDKKMRAYIRPAVETQFGIVRFKEKQFKKKSKHMSELGLPEQSNHKTRKEYQNVIIAHLNNPNTYQFGTFHNQKNSKVFYNPKTGVIVALTEKGEFITAYIPTGTQLEKYLQSGFLK